MRGAAGRSWRMREMQKIVLGVLWFATGVTGLRADEGPAEFEVAGVKIRVPAPEGYVRISGKNADFDKKTASSLAPGTVMVGFYGTVEDGKELEGGVFPRQERNYSVQVLQADQSITEADFGLVLAATEEQMDEQLGLFEKSVQEAAAKAGKTVAEIEGSDVAFEVGEMIPLGVLGKGEGWLTFGMRLSLDARRAEGDTKVRSTVVATMMRVGSKVMALYATDLTGRRGVVDELKDEVWKWRREVAAANRDAAGAGE